ncbi:MAG: sensor histidine kinase [Anaerolineae bacterium]|nr:sensor histidine kinase [Anaerolineae bacterium]
MGRRLNPFKRLSFRQRQFITLLALAVIPALIAVAVGLPASRRATIGRMTTQLEIVADLKTAQIHQWINQGRRAVQLVASEPDVQFHALQIVQGEEMFQGENLKDILRDRQRTMTEIFPSAQVISLLHPQTGRVLISTERSFEGRERGEDDYFLNGQTGLYVSPVLYSVGHEAPLLVVSAPVIYQEQLVGVVAVEMNLDDLQTTLSSRTGLGDTGTAYLVDSYGFYITLPRYIEGHPLRTIAKSEGVRRALDGENSTDNYRDPRGVAVRGVYRWLPEVSMGLLVEMQESEIAARTRWIWLVIVGAAGLTFVLALVAAHTLTNWLVRPLDHIREAAAALQAGNLDHRAPTTGPDEIGQLAEAFNAMAHSLQNSHTDLAAQVEQRTLDLQKANNALLADVARRLLIESDLRRHTAELEARNEDLDAFAHTVAHDLKNPLGIVLGYALMLEDGFADLPPRKVRTDLGLIAEAAETISRIVDELLLLATLRREDIAIQALDMGRVVRQVQRRLGLMIKDCGATVITPDEWPQARGYDPWIEEVWANYLSNALKYGGKPPVIMLGATRQPDGMLCFWMDDNGAGLTAEEQARLFTPFTRLDQTSTKGHGLGLSIVERIITKLGGTVGVQSEIGRGSRFYFTLPPADPVESIVSLPQSQVSHAAASPTHYRPRH